MDKKNLSHNAEDMSNQSRAETLSNILLKLQKIHQTFEGLQQIEFIENGCSRTLMGTL